MDTTFRDSPSESASESKADSMSNTDCPVHVVAKEPSSPDSRGSEEESDHINGFHWRSGLGLRKLAKNFVKEQLDGAKKIFERLQSVDKSKFVENQESINQVETLCTSTGGDQNFKPYSPDPSGTGPINFSTTTLANGESVQNISSDNALENVHFQPDTQRPENSDIGKHNHLWSPLRTAIIDGIVEPSQQIGRHLVQVWDLHDLVDDIKEQRNIWRERMKKNKIDEERDSSTERAAALSTPNLDSKSEAKPEDQNELDSAVSAQSSASADSKTFSTTTSNSLAPTLLGGAKTSSIADVKEPDSPSIPAQQCDDKSGVIPKMVAY